MIDHKKSQALHTKTPGHIIHSITPRQKRSFYYDLIWYESNKNIAKLLSGEDKLLEVDNQILDK